MSGSTDKTVLRVTDTPMAKDGEGSATAGNASQLRERSASTKLQSIDGGRAHAPSTQRRWEDDFPIIVHCHLRWDFVWQRPQQIFSRLAGSHRILFVEDPMEAPEPRLEISEPYPNIVRVVPFLPAGIGDVDAQCQATLPMLHEALRTHPLMAGRFGDPVQWFYSPMTSPCFMGQFGGRGVVYDCMDELANFRFAPPQLREREAFLLGKADVVFTGGWQLYESKSRHHANVHFYGCGVDVEHFGKARREDTVVPGELARLPHPVFGYFGVIDERLDYELIAGLADQFPDATVAMVGPFAKVDRTELPDRPNIHWLGQRDYKDLPALVKGFDVCLMPFALNEATQFINPTKTLEYMAAGKPIVSTAIADVVRNFKPIVDVARTHDEFLDAVERAWTSPSEDLIAQGIERAQGASWDATVRSMEKNIQEAVAARPARNEATA